MRALGEGVEVVGYGGIVGKGSGDVEGVIGLFRSRGIEKGEQSGGGYCC